MNLADEWASIPVKGAPAPAAAAPAPSASLADEWAALPTSKAAPAEPPKMIGPPEKLTWYERAAASLPSWMGNDTAVRTSLPGRLAMGAADPGVGLVQLAAHAIPGVDSSAVDARIKDVEGKYEAGRQANTPQSLTSLVTGQKTEPGTDWARIGGNVGITLLAPTGRVAEGANFVNRLIHAGKVGGAIGASQPVADADSGYWGQKAIQGVAGILGGVVGQPVAEGAAKVAGSAANAAMTFLRRFVPNGDEEIAANIVKNASPELKASVEQAVRGGGKVNKEALTRQLEADSLPVRTSLTPGQATQDPILISQEMNMRGKNPAMVYKYQDQNNNLIANMNAIRSNAAPEAMAADHVQAGQQIIEAGRKADAAEAAQVTALYQKLKDANGGAFPVDGKLFVANADAALGKEMKRPFLPQEVRSIMDDIKGGEPMTFEGFENLRTILAAEGRKAARAGDGNKVGAINAVRDQLEKLPMTGETAELKPLADAARAAAKDRFDHLRETKALRDIVNGKATPDDFIQRHIVGGNRQDLMNLTLTLKDDPIALQTIKAGVVDYLKKSAGIAGDNGNFSQAGYNKALEAIKPKLDVLFNAEEAAQLKTLGNVARYQQMQPRGSFVNNSNTDVAAAARSTAANYIDAATGTPVAGIVNRHVDEMLGKKAAASQLREVMSPSAGATTIGDMTKFLTKTLPVQVGSRAAVPVAAVAGQAASDQVKGEPRKRKQ